MEHGSDHSATHSYSLKEREALIPDSERELLRRYALGLIQESFIYRNYRETIETVDPITLHVDPSVPPNKAYYQLVPYAYNRTRVQAIVDHVDDKQHLGHAVIELHHEGRPMSDRTELVINGDDEFADTAIDVDDPQFYLELPHSNSTDSNNIIPLDAELCRDILRGIVEQADPDTPLDKHASLLEMIHRLIKASSKTSARRELSERFTHVQNIGSTVVSIADRRTRIMGEDHPRLVNYSVSVETTQPLSETDSATTYVNLETHLSGTNSTFGIDYHFVENPDDPNAPSRYEDLLSHEVAMFNDTEVAFPSRFGSKVIDGLRLLTENPDDYEQESVTWS